MDEDEISPPSLPSPSRARLAKVLREMADSVESGNSSEGYVRYESHVTDNSRVDITASYIVGDIVHEIRGIG